MISSRPSIASQLANAAVDSVRSHSIGGEHEGFAASESHDHVVAARGKTRGEVAVYVNTLEKRRGDALLFKQGRDCGVARYIIM
jgi:hypothetical protein